jgi:hypothetical protein
MKSYSYIILLSFLFSATAAHSQDGKKSSKDSSINFKVFGACIQCKDRIEEAAKGKGVRSADWDVNTKQLALVYNPDQTSIEKVQHRIVSVGHDLETKKAKDVVYNELPSCCHYREMESMIEEVKAETTDTSPLDTLNVDMDKSITASAPINEIPPHVIKGVVLESNEKGLFTPLSGASVLWLGTNDGTRTDSTGVFSITHTGASSSTYHKL